MAVPMRPVDLLRRAKACLARREAAMSFQEIKARSRAMPAARDAVAALLQPGCVIIPEIKRASPGYGPIELRESIAEVAESFLAGGAQLIACQTNPQGYDGSLADLLALRAAVDLPVVMRDIIFDPYQIHEARVLGADAVPLIVSLLDQARLASLIDRTESLGMTALVEVHTTAEVERALEAGGSVIGVNTRDLMTGRVYPERFGEIAAGLPESTIRVALSGVNTPREVLRYAAGGADAAVVGRLVMTADNRQEAVRTLVAAGQHPACPSRKAPYPGRASAPASS